jgi:tryptophan synthase alpha chain
MSRIADIFEKCRAENRTAIMPFLTAGFPSANTFLQLLNTLIRSGADMIEIGIPFSDPLADGRSIQYSSQVALANGTSMEKTICKLSDMRGNHRTPLILMSYYNPIKAYGASRLARRAHDAGIEGMIIPDIIPEEGGGMETICSKQDIDLIYLLAPTSKGGRRAQIIKRSRGFVYLVSVTGVTGARRRLPRGLNSWIRQVKKQSSLPVCVGFGISNIAQAQEISKVADGIIIGSAIVEIIRQAKNTRTMIGEVGRFISQLRERI